MAQQGKVCVCISSRPVRPHVPSLQPYLGHPPNAPEAGTVLYGCPPHRPNSQHVPVHMPLGPFPHMCSDASLARCTRTSCTCSSHTPWRVPPLPTCLSPCHLCDVPPALVSCIHAQAPPPYLHEVKAVPADPVAHVAKPRLHLREGDAWGQLRGRQGKQVAAWYNIPKRKTRNSTQRVRLRARKQQGDA